MNLLMHDHFIKVENFAGGKRRGESADEGEPLIRIKKEEGQEDDELQLRKEQVRAPGHRWSLLLK